MTDIASFQETYNERFGCCICLGPKLRMVTGQCQHRLCEDCLYIGEKRRPCMQNCPICALKNSFPEIRPFVPDTSIEIQRCLGVQECPNKCSSQLWFWEVDEHVKVCNKNIKSTVRKKDCTPDKKKRKISEPLDTAVESRPSIRRTRSFNARRTKWTLRSHIH